MSYHIVTIEAPQCELSCRNGQLICATEDDVKQIPIEDVAAIIITSFSSTLHSALFLEAARHGVPLILCEQFKPVSLMLPANRAGDTLLVKASLALDKRKKEALWRKTVDAKCLNQYLLALHLKPFHQKLPRLEALAYGKSQNKEATSARYYWGIFGESLGVPSFKRHADGYPLNGMLNYGYAVLLSTVLQKLFALGLDPTFGISHATRERSTPLAYDLMEQFRPCVDWRVAQWMQAQEDLGHFHISREFRRYVTGFVVEKVGYLQLEMPIQNCIEDVIRSFRKAILEQQVRKYKPWTPPNSKWAG